MDDVELDRKPWSMREQSLSSKLSQHLGYAVTVQLARSTEGKTTNWGCMVRVTRIMGGEPFSAEEFVFDSEARPSKFDAYLAAAIKAAAYLQVFDAADKP